MAFLTYSVERTAAGLPAEVLAALEPGPAVLIRATDGDRTVAYLVASVGTREVEVFHLADAAYGWPEGLVVAAAHFRDEGGRAFHDRYRTSPRENSRPEERLLFMETYRFEEPDRIILTERSEPGTVQEQVIDGVDLADRYRPWPAEGDWDAFVRFPGA